ncbi:hypothetical protein JCM3770_007412 [Rhodotorula araucariae]
MDIAAHWPWTTQRWNQVIPTSFHKAYYHLIDHIHDLEYIPQRTRLLATEGDVGDLVYGNILSSVVPILNKALHPALRGSLEIAVQHQPVIQKNFSVTQNDGTVTHEPVSVKLDHAIAVMPKYPPGHVKDSHYPNYRAGFVRAADWETRENVHWKTTENVAAHVNQVIAYTTWGHSPYCILTDYRETIAVAVQHDWHPTGALAMKLAACPYLPGKEHEHASAERNPIDDGLRHTACMLGIKAMHDLGLLNCDHRIEQLSHQHRRAVVSRLLSAPPTRY